MSSNTWSEFSRNVLISLKLCVFSLFIVGLQACATAEDVARKYRDQERQEMEREKRSRIPKSNMKNPGPREYPPAYVPRTGIAPPYQPSKPPPGYPGPRTQSAPPKDAPPKLGAGIRSQDDYRDTNSGSSGGSSGSSGY